MDLCMNNFLDFLGKSWGIWLLMFSLKTVFIWQLHCIFLYSQAETLLAMKDQARDLASAGNLLKKHQLLETEMLAREVSSVGVSLLWAEWKCL